jgi:hypothetical protein
MNMPRDQGVDVEYLIVEWEEINGLMAPSPEFFPEATEMDRNIAEVSLLSGRKEYWTVFACLMGYSQAREADPSGVLLEIPWHAVFSYQGRRPSTWDDFNSAIWDLHPFLIYSIVDPGFVPDVPGQGGSFLAAAYGVSLVLAGDTMNLPGPNFARKFQDCLRDHKANCPSYRHRDRHCKLQIRDCLFTQ